MLNLPLLQTCTQTAYSEMNTVPIPKLILLKMKEAAISYFLWKLLPLKGANSPILG